MRNLKKRKLCKKQLLSKIIDYQLKPFGVDYNYVIKNPEINGEPWYMYYKFYTKEMEDNWIEYSCKLISKYYYEYKNYLDRDNARKIFSWIHLNYGLTKAYEKNNSN